MKIHVLPLLALAGILTTARPAPAFAEDQTITLTKPVWLFGEKPLPIAVSGFRGEADQTLRFDLEVMGFKIVPQDAAQFLVTGDNNGRVEGRLMDLISRAQLFGKAYTGGTPRQQAHALADDIEMATRHLKGIAQSRIAFKVESGGNGEIYIADYDGHNAQPVTHDNTITAAPDWVPGHLALCYASYKFGNPQILYHDLKTGERRAVARYHGDNFSPAVSPDGRRVAMILNKDGWTDLYVSNLDGTDVKRLTKSPQDESSPCWSPDGRWICFAAKPREHRVLCKVPAAGGAIQVIRTAGVSSPTEPDWSPDGKWIAFTSQMGDFQICVVPAEGGMAHVLTGGEDPSWAANSRNLIFARRTGGGYVLSLLDVPTKQVKDVHRISGSCSQPSWAR